MSGKLIVFEGNEGGGKTTQIQHSRQWLQSVSDSALTRSVPGALSSAPDNFAPIVVTREPGGTELGGAIRSLLLSKAENKPIYNLTEMLLYAADRAQHVEEVLKPQLARDAIILCDRYTDSTIAYQGYGRGISLSLIHQLNSIATGGLESDLTLWLDVDVEVGLQRTKGRATADRIEQETIEFHRRVQQGYAELALAHPERIVRVDASLSEAAVQQQIQSILSQSLKLGSKK